MINRPAALSNPEMRKLLGAQIPADFADWFDFVAIGALLAFTWNAEPLVFAVLAVSMGLPYLLVGPFAGVFVDRANVRKILIWSNVGRAIATASLFFAPNWMALMVLIALRSAVDTFFTPAKQAAIQAMAMPQDRMGANGLSHAINQSSKIVAPALGGTLLVWFHPQTIFAVNAGVSLAAAMLLTRLSNIDVGASEDGEEESLLENFRTGFRDIRESVVLSSVLLMMAAGYFAMFFYDTLIAPLTRDIGFSQSQLGFALAAVGAGGVVGATILSLLQEAKRPFLMIGAGSLIGGLSVASLGFFETTGEGISIYLFIAIFGVLGITSAMAMVPFRTLIQNNVAAGRIGRVTALSEAANTIALLFAPFIGAAIASFSSVGVAFICGGLIKLGIAGMAFALRNRQ